jgi:hypothetical protein
MTKRNHRLEAEDYIRKEALPKIYGQKFRRERMKLSTGGYYDFDAVSDDEQILCCISTSVGETGGGNSAISKLFKMKAELLSMLLAGQKKMVMAFSNKQMAGLLQNEQDQGRIPLEVEIHVVSLPENMLSGLNEALAQSRAVQKSGK